MKAVTDATGMCRLAPLFHYEGVEYITVSFPEIDPRYFGELRLEPSQQEVVELRLQAARPIRGTITYNGDPLQGACLRAEPVTTSQSKPFTIHKWDGVSDANGNYEIYVPEASRYEVKVLSGVKFYDSLTGNEPIPISNADAESIPGPTISILSGNGTISGVVLGRNGKGFSSADLQLKLPPGQIIFGLVSFGSRSGGEFVMHGMPEGMFDLFACVRSPLPKGGSELLEVSNTVRVATGDSSVTFKLPRSQRP
jgi:hypothetical protein